MARYNDITKRAIKQVKMHKEQIRAILADQLAAHHSGSFQGVPLDCKKNIMRACLLNEQIDTDEWYDNLATNGIDNPDFSVYDDYLINGYYCWVEFTHKNVLDTVGFMNEISYRPGKILDFGAGIGASTVELAMAFPYAEIVYANTGDLQVDMAKRLANALGVTNITFTDEKDFASMADCDVVVAYEVFEHLREPISVLRETVLEGKCAVFIDNSSFTIRAPGHFPTYLSPEGAAIENTKFRRTYNKAIRIAGFVPANKSIPDLWSRGFWNNRPAVWVRGLV
jgi:hypothetical protein